MAELTTKEISQKLSELSKKVMEAIEAAQAFADEHDIPLTFDSDTYSLDTLDEDMAEYMGLEPGTELWVSSSTYC